MNIMHLKYAVEIAQTGSLNKAAENLYMGQPNLSRAIKELEASLGITIFDRSTKGMVPTLEGEEFLQYAKKILAQIDEVEAIYKAGVTIKQRFSISVPRSSYISEAFRQFTQNLSKSLPLEFLYRETSTMQTIQGVLESEYKLGIIRCIETYDKYFKNILEEKGLSYELISEFTDVLIMSKQHPMALKDNICSSDLQPYVEIAYADPDIPSLPLSTSKKEDPSSNIDKRILVFERASQLELLCASTEYFTRSDPMPNSLLDKYELIQKSYSDSKCVFKDILIYRKGYRLTDLDNLFITELCKSKRKYL